LPAIDSLGTEYLTLSLEIERLFPGFVDAYMGPASLKARAHSGDKPEPKALLDRARRLLTDIRISNYDANRKEFLRAQITGIITTCRKLAGEEIPYIEEVRDSFDIEVAYTPDAIFDAALAELEDVLPGEGSVRERNIAYRAQFVVDQATAARLIDLLLAETRFQTQQFIDLPAGDSVEISFVSNQPWSGYNWYLGSAKSRVEINTDLPIHATDLPALITHEAYPGHHTEHALKDVLLYQQKGYAEQAIQLINTPECLISEGIAVLAEQFAFGNGHAEAAKGPSITTEWMASVLMPAAALPFDPDVHARIQRASTNLRSVRSNAALRYYEEGQSEREVIQYLAHYGMVTEAEAAKRFSFIADPLWRPYIFTYSVGRTLLSAWLDAGDPAERLARYARVLSEQFTPSQIAGTATRV
jgi:hypothetical protein